MARRPSFTEAGITRPSQALPAPGAPAAAAESPRRAPARQNKKAVAAWVDPGAAMQLRLAAVRMGRSIQEIMLEAIDDWFAKNGMPRLVSEPQKDEAA